MNTFTNIFKFVELGFVLTGSVQQTLLDFKTATAENPVTGQQLQAAWQPAISEAQGIWPKINIAPALVLDICNAVADAAKNYQGK